MQGVKRSHARLPACTISHHALVVVFRPHWLLLSSPLPSNREGATPRAMVATAVPGKKNRGNTTGKRRALPSPLYHAGGKGSDAPVSALSPVHEAAASGQPETLSLLLQLGVSLEERDSAAGVEGETPLGRAVKAGQLECARLLLDAGAMIGRENARG